MTLISVYGVDRSKVSGEMQATLLCKLFGTLQGDARWESRHGIRDLARSRAAMTREMIATFGVRYAKRHVTVIP